MVDITDFHKPEIGGFEQVMKIDSFNKLDMGDTRTSSGGAWYEDKTHKKRFFIKPIFTWTSDNRDIAPLCLQGSPIMALFLGNIFKILMKGRAPDHLLIEKKAQAFVASTFLDDFVTFTKIGINREYTKIENAKGIHRYLAATIILSNFDTGTGNFGLIQESGKERVAGIDLDKSLLDSFSSFQGYFNRLKYNAEFSYEMFIWDEDIDLNEVHNKLRNKVNFQKLLDRLDKACDLVEENFDDVKQHLEKQEANFLSLSSPFLEKYKNKMYGDRMIFQEKPCVGCHYDKREKIIKCDDGQTLAEKILSILSQHVETIRKSSKTLNIAAEICKNKTEDCINIVDEYVKSYDKKDVQVGEASHFLNWLEVNKKISSDRIKQLKDKYCVSTGAQSSAVSAVNNPQSTAPTAPQQKQPINGAPQKVASNATPFEETPTKSEINNNLQSEEQDSQTPIITHNSNQGHFLGISTRGWIIISTCAIVGCAIGATLVATGIIPAIIGLIATAILAGAAGVVTGGAIGAGMACLTKIVINKYCGEEAAAQPV